MGLKFWKRKGWEDFDRQRNLLMLAALIQRSGGQVTISNDEIMAFSVGAEISTRYEEQHQHWRITVV